MYNMFKNIGGKETSCMSKQNFITKVSTKMDSVQATPLFLIVNEKRVMFSISNLGEQECLPGTIHNFNSMRLVLLPNNTLSKNFLLHCILCNREYPITTMKPLSLQTLSTWVKKVAKPGAKRASEKNPPRIAGEKQCYWCDAKKTCPEFRCLHEQRSCQ